MLNLKTIILVPAIALSGCMSLDGPIGESNGEFAAQNLAAQVEDTTAIPGAPVMDASMSDAAIARYRSGETKSDSEAEAAPIMLNLAPGS